MARKPHLRPADVVIKEFGIRPLAAELTVSPSTVWRWKNSDPGLVPSEHHVALLDLAKRWGKQLTAEDLINGRS
jgi:hypothetical protein